MVMKICRQCLTIRFGWQWTRLSKWLGRQEESRIRIQERKSALEMWRRHGLPSGIIRYAERYGVWLVPQEEIAGGDEAI